MEYRHDSDGYCGGVLMQIGIRVSMGIGSGAGGGTWDGFLVEGSGVEVGVTFTEWIEITNGTSEHNETAGVEVGVTNTEWIEITNGTSEHNETAGVEVGIASILWVEVESE